MSHKNVFHCDVCSVEKKHVNHWILAELPRANEYQKQIKFKDWCVHTDSDYLLDLCGSECAVKYLNGWITAKL
jgi:hypothetical protein